MIGRLVYQARRLMSFSPKTAYYRDIVRPKILKTAPVVGTTDPIAEVHVLTSERDWVNTTWALKSFYAQVPYKFRLVIHGDPTLTAPLRAQLTEHFPDARIIDDATARVQVLSALKNYPKCRELRENRIISKKAFDFPHFLSSDRMIFFDSDLLFFKPPQAFLAYFDADHARVNVFNPDIETSYSISPKQLQAHGYPLADEVNSGFGLAYRESFSLDYLEEVLAIPEVTEGHQWRFEQTLQAIQSSKFGVELLPEEYRVFLDGHVEERPFRHYVGAIRDKMYTEGMRKLQSSLLK
jgi:hypothetical protein